MVNPVVPDSPPPSHKKQSPKTLSQQSDKIKQSPETSSREETQRREETSVKAEKKKKAGEASTSGDHPAKEDDKKNQETKTELITFTKFKIAELDGIFVDMKDALDPFVGNRKKMEKAEKDFKEAVNSLQKVKPKSAFRDYVQALKTKLKKDNIFIKIKNGVVVFGGEVGKVFSAVSDVKNAIADMISAGKGLKDMLPSIVHASEEGVERSSSVDVMGILKREFTSVWDGAKILRLKNAFLDNAKKLKQAPKMVREFYNEARKIVLELYEAFADEDEKERIKDEMPEESDKKKTDKGTEKKEDGEKGKGKGKIKEKEKEKEKEKVDDEDEDDKKKSEGKEKANEKGKDAKKKEEFHKKLAMDKIDLPDIDKFFQDFATVVNPFIFSREQLQTARESFENIIQTISSFEAGIALKDYLKELKEKAKKGDIQIYIDVSDGTIKVKSVKGVPPPKEYRNAAKTLTDMKKAAAELVKLEPDVQRGVEAVIRDVTVLKPDRDLRKLVKFKELPKLPGKIKKFNENRKKVQAAPAVVKEFIEYVRQLVRDIEEFFSEEDKKSEEDSTETKKESEGSGAEASGEDKDKDPKTGEPEHPNEGKGGPSESVKDKKEPKGSGTKDIETSCEYKNKDPKAVRAPEQQGTKVIEEPNAAAEDVNGLVKSDESEYEDARWGSGSGKSDSPEVEVKGLVKLDDEYVEAKSTLA